MARIELDEVRIDIMTKAENIRNKILIGNVIEEYRAFVASGYEHKITNSLAIRRYRENREHYTAIISLILSSDLRIAEVANIELDDLKVLKHLKV